MNFLKKITTIYQEYMLILLFLITSNMELGPSNNQITPNDDISNYENMELIENHTEFNISPEELFDNGLDFTEGVSATQLYKATRKGTSNKVVLELVIIDGCEAATENQIKIYTYLQNGRKVTENDGLTHLISHGISNHSLTKTVGSVTYNLVAIGRFLALDFHGLSVFYRWVASKDKITKGLQMFIFRAVCLLGEVLVDRIESLHKRNVVHVKLNFKSILLEEKSPENTSGDKVSGLLLTDLEYATIFKVEGEHIAVKRRHRTIRNTEESEYLYHKVISGHTPTRKADMYSLLRLIQKGLGGKIPALTRSDISRINKRKEDFKGSLLNDLTLLDKKSLPEPDQNRKVKLMTDLKAELDKIEMTSEPDYKAFKEIFTKYLKPIERTYVDALVWYPQKSFADQQRITT